MNPHKVEINWHEGWANTPDLVLHVNEEDVLSYKDMVFDYKGGCYFAFDPESKQVAYFYYDAPGNGYGGRSFYLKMRDGSTRQLVGPWSSRCSIMNEMGFPHSVECVFKIDDGPGYRVALLIEEAKRLLAESGEDAEYVYKPDQHRYEIVKK